jgi:hypothetical protein
MNAVVVKDLRVTFSIEKHLESTPNECKVSVYGLSEQSRALFQTKPLHVTLDVGYGGQLSRIFSGDLRWGTSSIETPEVVTNLELADGDRAINHARVNHSYPPKTVRKDILKDVIGAMGLKVPRNLEEMKEVVDQFVGGFSSHGNASKVITKLLQPRGLGWSIQDGEFQVLREKDTRDDQAVVISVKTGMIEVPQMAAPEKAGKPAKLTVKSLISKQIAALKPGGKILLESAQLNNQLFKVTRILYEGDTHSSVWNATIEANPL